MKVLRRLGRLGLWLAVATWPVLLGLFALVVYQVPHDAKVDPMFFSALAGTIPVFFAILAAALVYRPTAGLSELRGIGVQLQRVSEDYRRDAGIPAEDLRRRIAEAWGVHGEEISEEDLDRMVASPTAAYNLEIVESAAPGELDEALRRSRQAAAGGLATAMVQAMKFVQAAFFYLRLVVGSSMVWSVFALTSSMTAIAASSTDARLATMLGVVAWSQVLALPLAIGMDWVERFLDQVDAAASSIARWFIDPRQAPVASP